jgi:hypothetical protein
LEDNLTDSHPHITIDQAEAEGSGYREEQKGNSVDECWHAPFIDDSFDAPLPLE